MIEPLLAHGPSDRIRPVWRRDGLRQLEHLLQTASDVPLMDRAGQACARLAMAVAPHARRVLVFAGPGNNGGDGLEAALELQRRGKPVVVYLMADAEKLPMDAGRALQRAHQQGVQVVHGLPEDAIRPEPMDLCIDALLGIGASRAPEGRILQAIEWINHHAARVLAVDLPSGLDADSGEPLGASHAVVKADDTLTMLAAKPGLLMGQGRDVCGRLWLARLELPELPPADWDRPPAAELNPAARRAPPAHASHKGTHGDVAVVGGECDASGNAMTGAALLAAQAALHGGAGRVLLCLLGDNALPAALPADLMPRTVHSLDLPRLTVVAGCGGGRAVAQPLGRLLQHSARLVLDADALNRLGEDPWLQDLLRQRQTQQRPTVLTPHPLEAARLLGCTSAQVQADRLAAAHALAERYGACVVLKGSGTVLAEPGRVPRINTTGNGLLAIGGTGDVLAGLLGALLARGHDAWQASCQAAWLHGRAADEWPGDQALTATRLAARLF